MYKVFSSLNQFTMNETVPSKSPNMRSLHSLASRTGSAVIKGDRPLRTVPWILTVCLLLACIAPAQAQVLATQRAGFGLPANQVPAPNTPGGGVVVGGFFYATDAVNGFRHYLPSDPTNPDPVNSGILTFDNNGDSMSMGGAAGVHPVLQDGPGCV